jgi:hypothetical protein
MNQKQASLFLMALLLIAVIATQALAQAGTPVYNNIPNPLPPNVPSLGYQATSTAEWGDYIALAGTDRRAATATVTMSDWALHSNYPSMDAAGFTHPITLNIYQVDHSGPTPAAGALVASVTKSFLIPWRPEADVSCSGGRWKASDGNCYSGYAFTITFDLRSLALTLPNELIFGVAYNTNTWGYNPIGQPGPYESLNVGTANAGGVGVPPSVGTDVEPDATFWNTSFGPFYADGGAGGVGTFRRDTNWLDFSPAVKFTAYTVATAKDGCKGNGWQTLSRADASPFKNQGDCVQYVNTGK